MKNKIYVLLLTFFSFLTVAEPCSGKIAGGFHVHYDLAKHPVKGNYLTIENVPDGCYRVEVVIGSKKSAGSTTVRGESRRLFLENIETARGEFKKYTFTVHKRDLYITSTEKVRIKPREKGKLNWDENLTLEITGRNPQVKTVDVRKVDHLPVVYLCGNSTVVDQSFEPWTSWGQIIPRFFDEHVCFANFAESGEAANTFIAAGRLKKIMTEMKAGDYLFVEFGHNDQKQKGPDKGPYKSFWKSLSDYIQSAREKGAHIVFLTPTQRRSFDENGRIKDTHGKFPQAMRDLAEKEHVDLIDLSEMTRTLYESMGEEGTKKIFVHYPAHTFPGQDKALADNTHFNPYGAYEIAKCVIEGMKKLDLPIIKYLRKDYGGFDPAHPDRVDSFYWTPAKNLDLLKPEGN